jgi:type III restriction enzyme/adenine-specific DNA-methyltransferase
MFKAISAANDKVAPNGREIAALREHFPSCFGADGSFDMELFGELLGGSVQIGHEGYGLRFLGRSYARLLASLDTTTVIRPDEGHNARPENANSENVYISGDNLDGLKHLLKSYARRVKCVYIDPPYNTGSDDFAYNDRFSFTADGLAEKLSIEAEQAKRILDLAKRGFASHSAWLMFMYPRLLLARDILTEDGVIFISIDDNEQSNLKLLCNNVFGEENFVGQIIWQTATDNNHTQIATEHEYVICYAKKIETQDAWELPSDKGRMIQKKYEELLKEIGNKPDLIQTAMRQWIRLPANWDDLSGVRHYDYVDERGVYYPGNSANTKPGGYTYDIMHPVTNKVCAKPGYGYRWTRETFDAASAVGDVQWGEDESTIPKIKKRVETATQMLKSYYYEDNRATSSQLKRLFDDKVVFNNPKSINFLMKIIRFVTNNNDTICDFFSGSGSTAEAVMQLNSEDPKSKRRFIMVQMPEPCDCRKATGKAAIGLGCATISQIGVERIKRAAAKIRESGPLTANGADLGFRHYALVEPSPDTLDKLEAFEPNILAGDLLAEFGKPTVLATWLVRDGYGFVAHAQEVDFAGYRAHYIGRHLYLIDPVLSDAAIMAIVERMETDGGFSPENVVMFGYSFNWRERDQLEINLKRIKATQKNLRVNLDIRY